MRRIIVLWFGGLIAVFFQSELARAQLKQLTKIDTVAKAIYADNLDNVYLLSASDELLMYNKEGKLKWRYSNNRFGKLSSIDVSDPLRIVLFYADFQQVLILNNNLNEITSYSFAKNGNLLVSAVASANNNGLWIFDRTSQTLVKLSSYFTEDIRSANLYQLLDMAIEPKKLLASDQYVFVQQQNHQVLQFDRFGAFVRELPVEGITDFNITRNELAYLTEGKLVRYPLGVAPPQGEAIPINVPTKQVAVGNKIIAVLTEKAVFLLFDN